MIHLLMALTLFSPNERSVEICHCSIPSEEIQKNVDALFEAAAGESGLVGLAAPQIGILKRIVVVDLATDSMPPQRFKEFINPEILWRSDEQPVADQILLRYYDRECDVFTEEFTGSIAHIFQHEIDHLDGIYKIP